MGLEPHAGTTPPRGRRRFRALNDPVGLLLVPLLGLGAISGAVLWWQLTTTPGVAVWLVGAHAYAGLVALPLLLLKTASGASAHLPTRRSRSRRRSGLRPRLPVIMGLLLAAMLLTLFGSGTALFANVGPIGALKSVHAWSALAAVVPFGYHLVRYLRRSSRVVGTTLAPEHAAAPSRRGLLAGALGLAGWGLLRLTGSAADSAAAQGPNDFPVTITAAGSDQPDPRTWRMRIAGRVERPLVLSLTDLRDRVAARHRYSLDCVLGWSATRTWGGVPLRDLLEEAGADRGYLSVVVTSTTGYEVALLRDLVDDRRTLVAWEVDGVDLTPEHGYPARIMAPDVIGERCLKWIDTVTVVAA